MWRWRLLIAIWLFAGISRVVADGEEQRFESGLNRMGLLKKYSSQDCSRCPLAKHWINGFENDERLWVEVVPVMFHVDYWDRLEWKDPFALFENTIRQYAHRKRGDVASVYTPGLVSNGKE